MIMLSKVTAVQNHWSSEAWKTKAEVTKLSEIRLRDYKRENLENKGKHEIIMEESSTEGTGPRGAVLPDMMMGLGSSPGEGMDICKCIMPSWQGGTLNSRRAASPFVRNIILVDLVILNYNQLLRKTPNLASSLVNSPPYQHEDFEP
ncbi:hypothetical protein TNCV_2984301 [Trichonephila clavipes]|nr:hypothetical protein TNCV_2984301 [Trichonephila clavipes]